MEDLRAVIASSESAADDLSEETFARVLLKFLYRNQAVAHRTLFGP